MFIDCIKSQSLRRVAIVFMLPLKVGDNVHYQPDHYADNEYENGVVKEIPQHTDESVRVVYNCNGEWHRYKEYTSAMTDLRDLHLGWKRTSPESD